MTFPSVHYSKFSIQLVFFFNEQSQLIMHFEEHLSNIRKEFFKKINQICLLIKKEFIRKKWRDALNDILRGQAPNSLLYALFYVIPEKLCVNSYFFKRSQRKLSEQKGKRRRIKIL